VKGVGDNAVAAIIEARDADGPFESIWDFCRRVDQAQVNKRALESLIRSGALDSTGATRFGMLDALPAAMGQAARRRNDMASGQESLFGGLDQATAPVELDPPLAPQEMPKDELLALEKEALGLYVSSHPLQDCRRQLARAVTCGLAGVGDRADGELVTLGGMIGAVKGITTRKGEPMMFVRLDDLEGQVEVVVVPAVLAEARELLTMDAMVIMTGRIDQKGEGETKLVAQSVRAFIPEEGAEEDRLLLRVDIDRLAATPLDELQRLLRDHRGEAAVILDVVTGDGPRRLRLGREFAVDLQAKGLVAELKTLFGERCLA
jgi:DNA polymerase-3 subunit alpha